MKRRYGKDLRDFPWRRTRDPYEILVSEFMLQQTQTQRVLGFYQRFLLEFPTLQQLASSPPGAVIRAWQGLGYNRRALNLHQTARSIAETFSGEVPKTEEELHDLPGIGVYTARAVLAFAYDQPQALLETNIRAVLIYEFFPHRKRVSEQELQELAQLLLDRENPRDWNYALMDYGVELKRHVEGINLRWKGYSRQSKFEGSVRQVRGAIIRTLSAKGPKGLRVASLRNQLKREFELGKIEKALQGLSNDGLVELSGQNVYLTTSS